MANVVIDIAAEFTGKKAFKQAETGTEKLTKGVKKLALAFASVFATQKIAAFGKASVKAFMADEKAAAILTKTLNNMGLAFDDTRVKNFISDLEKTTGVLDSSLRPAMQALLTTTGSVAKSQELLKLAIDVSAGSGVELSSVAKDLSAAYTGNTKGLKKYYLGLTQAQLKATKFSDLQAIITKQFSGQNATQLDTYAGKLSLLNVAYDNMQETIGKGLLDSFQLLAGDNGIGGATTAMEEFGRKTSNIILGLATLTEKITPKSGGTASGILNYLLFGVLGPLSNYLDKTGYNQSIKPKPFATPMSISGQSSINDPADKARTAAEKAYLKRIKELNALLAISNGSKAREIALTADQQALEELKKKFDVERIGLFAALNQATDEETRMRLKSLIAIYDNDAALALKIKAELEAAEAARLLALSLTQSLIAWGNWQTLIGNAFGAAALGSGAPIPGPTPVIDKMTQSYAPGDIPGISGIRGFKFAGADSSPTYIINATGIGDQQIASVVQDAIQNLNRYGNSTTYAGAL
jgi:hypothetical protein